MSKFYIVPINQAIEINAENADEAIIQFATTMDSDMNAYFKVVSEKEYKETPESISVPLPNGTTLFAEKNLEDDMKEIIVGLKDRNGYYKQDFAIIGAKFRLENGNPSPIIEDGAFTIKTYEDEFSEDVSREVEVHEYEKDE